MQRIVLSASRRTDIPAFYMPWFMDRIDAGAFEVPHPFGGRPAVVPATPDRVHTIVFWSKDFGPFLHNGYGDLLTRQGYRLFFNFTINSTHAILEPAVPSLKARLDQLSALCDRFGPERIQWRFDPICCYVEPSGRTGDNTAEFEAIARRAAESGLTTCITSFVDLYRKVRRRCDHSPLTLLDPSMNEKIERIRHMAAVLGPLGISLCLCCEKSLLAALPVGLNVTRASCIPNHRLAALHGSDVSLQRDSGQRVAAGCGCRVAKDIGSYALHPCRHNCLFCYANPQVDQGRSQAALP